MPAGDANFLLFGSSAALPPIQPLHEQVKALKAENARLRTALTHYAQRENWVAWPHPDARQADVIAWEPQTGWHLTDPWRIAEDALKAE